MWSRQTVRSLAVYVFGIAILGLAAFTHSTRLFLWVAAILLVGVFFFHRLWRLPRRPEDLRFDLIVGIVAVVLGGALVMYWVDGGKDAAGYVGAAAFAFGYRTLVRVLRGQCSRVPNGPLIYMTIGVAATLVAAIAIVRLDPLRTEIRWGWLIFWALAAITGLAMFAEGLIVSETRRPKPARRHGWYAVAGLVLLIGSVWRMSSLGMSGVYVSLAVLLVLLGVGAIVSETDYDVAGMVLVTAIWWATSPADIEVPEFYALAEGPVLVTLGDSYISGEGAAEYYSGTNEREAVDENEFDRRNECRRAPTAYPVAIAQDLFRLVWVACSGAEIRHIDAAPQYPGEPQGRDIEGGLDQLDNAAEQLAGSPVDAVLLSIGGNDAGFGEIGQNCIYPGDCTAVASVWLDELAELEGRLEVIYGVVKDAYPGVPVAVVPYPTPVSPEKCGETTLNEAEHAFIAGFAGQLQGVIRAAALSAGVHYLDVEDVFEAAGMRVCDDDRSGVNFIDLNPVGGSWDQGVNPRNWIHNSLHPNERGHGELARVIGPMVAELGPNPTPVADDHPVLSLEELIGAASIGDCDTNCDDPVAWGADQLGEAVRTGVVPAAALATAAWMLWVAGIVWRRE